MGMAKFQIYKGDDGQLYFRLIAANGEKILRSEGYTSRSNCKNGISSVKSNAPADDRYQREASSDGQFYFNLTARNGEVIGTSEMYTTESSRNNGIEAVKKTAPDAPVEDIS